MLDYFYFIIFFGNIFLFTYYSFNELRKDEKLFSIIHNIFSSKNNTLKEIRKIPYCILIEDSLINIYLSEFISIFTENYRIFLIRSLFALSFIINFGLINNRNFVLMQILHNYILSYFIIPNTPLRSLFIHMLNNFLVNIFRYYLHRKCEKIEKLRSESPLMYELERIKEKKIVTERIAEHNLNFWFDARKDDITTPKTEIKPRVEITSDSESISSEEHQKKD